MKRKWIAPAVVVCLLVLVAAGIVLASGGSGPVLTCGDYSLDNTGLAYYYWSEFFYFSEAYGEYLKDTVDFSSPLNQQAWSEDKTWQDYLLEETLETVRQTMSMVFQARAEGFSMPEDYAGTYNQVLVNFASAAREGGYASLDDYLRASYGSQASRESFEAYLHDSHLAAAYADHLLAEIQPTDQEVRNYFRQHRGEYEEDNGFDPEDESQWLETVREDLRNETYQNRFREICSQYPFQVNYSAAVLVPPEGLYE